MHQPAVLHRQHVSMTSVAQGPSQTDWGLPVFSKDNQQLAQSRAAAHVICPSSGADIDDYAHFALAYTGDSPPAQFPSEPSLIVFYHSTTRASPVLEVLNQAAPGHQFMVWQLVAKSGEYEWQDLNWTDGLPPAPLHVWMVARNGTQSVSSHIDCLGNLSK
jgi:hypothetical protein